MIISKRHEKSLIDVLYENKNTQDTSLTFKYSIFAYFIIKLWNDIRCLLSFTHDSFGNVIL